MELFDADFKHSRRLEWSHCHSEVALRMSATPDGMFSTNHPCRERESSNSRKFELRKQAFVLARQSFIAKVNCKNSQFLLVSNFLHSFTFMFFDMRILRHTPAFHNMILKTRFMSNLENEQLCGSQRASNFFCFWLLVLSEILCRGPLRFVLRLAGPRLPSAEL